MSVSTFTTQRQLMMKNMPASALDNPFAKQQKVLLYLMPIFFAISGINFPIGVLLYWLTTNVWSMCQQFYVIRRMPAPGSPAEKAMQERRMKRGKEVQEFTVKGLDAPEAAAEEPPSRPAVSASSPPATRRRRRRRHSRRDRSPRGRRTSPTACRARSPRTSPRPTTESDRHD